jgi:hypothetical protein
MAALMDVAASLGGSDEGCLTALEWRTLAWSRCSLAALYGIRIDETMSGPVVID